MGRKCKRIKKLRRIFLLLGKDIIEICDLPEYILDTIDSNYSRTVCNKVSDNIKSINSTLAKTKHHEIRL